MVELIFGYILMEKHNLSSNDLFKLVQKGELTPRDMYNSIICRPDRKPPEYVKLLQSKKKSLEIAKISLKCQDDILIDMSLGEPIPAMKIKEIETEIEAIESELTSLEQNHRDPYDWKNISLPSSKAEAGAFLEYLSSCQYLMEEVNAAIGGKGLGALTNEDSYLIDNSNRKKLLPSQRHKIAVIHIAKKLWEADPTITIADMAHLDPIIGACDGKAYSEQTIRKWLKAYCPNRTPGRRPKAKKQ